MNDENGQASMQSLHTWTVPTSSGSTEITANPGQAVVIVGANGAGKSGLATWMISNFPDGNSIKRLLAHRQVWLSASASNLTPSDRINQMSWWSNEDRSEDSRWKNTLGDSRNSALLLDLVSAENRHNAKIVRAVESNSNIDVLCERPFIRLNRILQCAGFNVDISISELGELSTKNSNGIEYPIALMSDGEKSGLILVGEVLTAPKNSVILLDEPERHLHRSVSAPLVTHALRERPDCAFVVFTHDLALANELKSGKSPAYVLKECTWQNGHIVHWDVQHIPYNEDLPQGVFHAILGARKKVLFCEGSQGGLDDRVYSLLYPDWQVVAVGSCNEVIRSTKALRNLERFSWVEARGVIDADRRAQAQVEVLMSQGIWVSAAHEIENLLFLPISQLVVARKQSMVRDVQSDYLLRNSHQQAVAILRSDNVKDRVVNQAILADARFQLAADVDSLKHADIENGSICLEYDPDPVNFSNQYDELLEKSDLKDFMLAFPIRESRLRDTVAKSLRCRDKNDYIDMVMQSIQRDQSFREALRRVIERRKTDDEFLTFMP